MVQSSQGAVCLETFPVQVGRESTGDGRESDDDAFVALLYVMTVASLLLS